MFLKIETLAEKKLLGNRIRMTYANNRTFMLWQDFMSRRREIENKLTTELISMQVYDKSLDFKDFNLNTEFEKWAVAEVANFDNIPSGMETYILKGGLYAVFIHKGDSSAFQKTSQYIFGDWLPHSKYALDQREHFEVLGAKYKLNDPDSEEEIWIPIK